MLGGDELASFDATVHLRLDVLDSRFAERTLERVAQDGALLDDGFAFEIAITREVHRAPCNVRRLTRVFDLMRTVLLGGFDNPRRLVPVFLGQPLVPVLHLFMPHVQLAFAGLVRRDLRGRRASSTRFGQVGLDLLTTRAGGVEVFAGVAGDLGLPAATALDLVPQRRQPRRQLRTVDRGRVLLRAVQLSWLKRANRAVGGLGQG